MFSEPTWFNPGGGFSSDLIANSVWLDGSADFLSAELGAKTRTRAVIGCWVQKTGFTTSDATIFSKKGTAQFAFRMQDQSGKDGKISIFDYDGSSFQYAAESTSMVLRDLAFYHLMISIDTGASAGSRLKYYINGVDQTSTLTVSTDYTASDNPSITGGSGEPTQWGVGYSGTSQFIPAYLAQCFLLDDDSIQNSDVSVSDILESYEHGSSSQFGPRADSEIAALASSAGGSSFCLSFENSILLGQDISDNSETNVARSMTGLKSDDLDVGAASLLTDGTQFGSWYGGSNLVYQNSNTATKAWWGVDFGADGVAITKAIVYGNQSSDGSTAGFTSTSISNVTFTLFGSDSAQATNNNDLSGLTTVGSVVVSNTQTKGVTATISASSNTTEFRYYYVQMNTTESTRRLVGEIELFTVGNSFSTTSMSAANQSTNTPSNVVPKFNPLQDLGATLSEGNSRITLNNSVFGTQPITINLPETGKWYGEFLLNATAQSDTGIGLLLDVADKSVNLVNPASAADYPNRNNDYYLLQLSDGNKINGDISGSSYGSATASGETAQWAYDSATRKLWFGNEGTFFNSGDPAAGSNEAFTLAASDTVTLIVWDASNARTADLTIRNGDATFEHTPPTGFSAISSGNLPTPDFQGVDHFQPVLYTGNGSSRTISTDVVPGLVWIKNRDTTDEHKLVDKVRGATKELSSDSSLDEETDSNGLTAFATDGFNLGSGANGYNDNTEDFVAWVFGNDGTRAANNNGAKNIFETVDSSGAFAIFDWDGTSSAGAFQHSLGGEIEMIIVKRRNVADWNWYVWHKAIPDTKAYLLDTNDSGHTSTYWNDVAVNAANQFTLGSTEGINKTGDEIISYAFRSVPGVCKVGSYTGNGNNNGPYISVGFLPRYILVRSTSGTRNWNILDTVRNPVNIDSPFVLLANTTLVDTAAQVGAFDILSDGFKPRDTASNTNGSGETYLYMAMADIASGADLCPIYGR